MPVATTQIRSERIAKPLKATSSKVTTVESPTKTKTVKSLQQITPEETSKWLADLNDPSVRQYRFDSSDDPFEYPFKVGAILMASSLFFKRYFDSCRMQTLCGYELKKESGWQAK